ncbi:MAG: hypothetical protein RLZZ28_1877 [Bacteroidota bacterium]|jgi:outer membrane protein TolC
MVAKKIVSVLFFGICLCSSRLPGQNTYPDSLLVKAFQTDELLPLLIDSALKNSPMVKRMENSILLAGEGLELNKKSIYNALSLNSSYNYGTNFSAVNNPNGGNVNNFTSTQSGFYNLGIGLQLPLTHIISRKNLIKSGEAQVKIATAEKDNAAQFVKQEVIRLYQECKLNMRLLVIGGNNRESAKVSYQMAQREFIQGQSTVDQESRVMDIYNKSVIEYETYVNHFQTSYLQLESYIGIKLSSFLKLVK